MTKIKKPSEDYDKGSQKSGPWKGMPGSTTKFTPPKVHPPMKPTKPGSK